MKINVRPRMFSFKFKRVRRIPYILFKLFMLFMSFTCHYNLDCTCHLRIDCMSFHVILGYFIFLSYTFFLTCHLRVYCMSSLYVILEWITCCLYICHTRIDYISSYDWFYVCIISQYMYIMFSF